MDASEAEFGDLSELANLSAGRRSAGRARRHTLAMVGYVV